MTQALQISLSQLYFRRVAIVLFCYYLLFSPCLFGRPLHSRVHYWHSVGIVYGILTAGAFAIGLFLHLMTIHEIRKD